MERYKKYIKPIYLILVTCAVITCNVKRDSANSDQSSDLTAAKIRCNSISEQARTVYKTNISTQNMQLYESNDDIVADKIARFTNSLCMDDMTSSVNSQGETLNLTANSEKKNASIFRRIWSTLLQEFNMSASERERLSGLVSLGNQIGVSLKGFGNISLGGLGAEVSLLKQNNEIALFCALGPEVNIGTSALSAGIGISAGPFKTLGCRNNDEYKGGFLTIGLNGGLSVFESTSGYGALAVGVKDLDLLVKSLIETNITILREYGKSENETNPSAFSAVILLANVNEELHAIQSALSLMLRQTSQDGIKQIGAAIIAINELIKASISLMTNNQFSAHKLNQDANTQDSLNAITSTISGSMSSLAGYYENSLNQSVFAQLDRISNAIHRYAPGKRLLLLDSVINLLSTHASGCDALSAGISLGIGTEDGIPLSANVNISYSYYSNPNNAKLDLDKLIPIFGQIGQIKTGLNALNQDQSFKALMQATIELFNFAKNSIAITRGSNYAQQCVSPYIQDSLEALKGNGMDLIKYISIIKGQ